MKKVFVPLGGVFRFFLVEEDSKEVVDGITGMELDGCSGSMIFWRNCCPWLPGTVLEEIRLVAHDEYGQRAEMSLFGVQIRELTGDRYPFIAERVTDWEKK